MFVVAVSLLILFFGCIGSPINFFGAFVWAVFGSSLTPDYPPLSVSGCLIAPVAVWGAPETQHQPIIMLDI
jgi:hypothetical protein